ncbi:MAG: hypothetical protein KJO26_14830 [Deltaproteobacteria bacterium]|nr:hypothetical protein [Desulfofustis sp.]MBT8352492.1 hypothetical protein [Deltaproteobacteria bacterium]MBT8355044.1 hypothetical protein [Desulfofustis sp.]
MRPFVIHILILTSLIALGIAIFIMEALISSGGGLIQKFAFTKLYWLAFIGYSIFSTFIVLSISIFHKIKKEVLTKKAVILSHVIPIGLLWVFISLGFHDLIEDAWNNRATKLKYSSEKAEIEQAENKRLPIPPAPSKQILKYDSPEKPVEPDKQTAGGS